MLYPVNLYPAVHCTVLLYVPDDIVSLLSTKVMLLYACCVDRLPLLYVFLSGIGFSIQALLIKLLSERGFHGSFLCVFMRGLVQLLLSSIFIYYDKDRLPSKERVDSGDAIQEDTVGVGGEGVRLFGSTAYIKWILFLRSFSGFGGILFAFLSIELISIGDSTVLQMLSPMLCAIIGCYLLNESWKLPEFLATIVSLVGATLVAKPPMLFGSSHMQSSPSFYLGVIYSLLACVTSSCAYICVRILGTTAKMPWANVVFAQALGQVVFSFPSSYLLGQPLHLQQYSWQEYSAVSLVGVIGAFSQVLMTLGMQREKSAAATAMRMSDLLFGFIWQALFTTDEVSRLSVAGALLVSSSILIIVLSKQSEEIVVNDDSIDIETDSESRQEEDNVDTKGELLQSRAGDLDCETTGSSPPTPSIQSRLLSSALTSAEYARKTLTRSSTVGYERIETKEHCVEMLIDKR